MDKERSRIKRKRKGKRDRKVIIQEMQRKKGKTKKGEFQESMEERKKVKERGEES